MTSAVQKIETKVIAATAGGGAGAAVGQFLLWLLAVLFWHASNSAGAAAEAIAKVPGPVATIVTLLVAAIGALIGGYAAPHSERPDLIDQSGTPASTANVPVITSASSGISAGTATVTVTPVIGPAVLGSTLAPEPINGNAGVVDPSYDWTPSDQPSDSADAAAPATT